MSTLAPTSAPVGDPWADDAPRRLSPSRASDFMQCPRMYRWKTIDKVEDPATLAQAWGTLVHAVLEWLYALPPVDRTLDAAVQHLPVAWQETLADEGRGYTEHFPSWGVTHEDVLAQSKALLARYFTMETPTLLGSPGLEQDLRSEVAGVPLRGIIDRVDIAGGGQVRVVDYKTGRAPAPRYADKALWQLRFYAVMWRAKTGTIPARLRLVYLGEKNPGLIEHSPTAQELDRFEEEIADLWAQINTAFDTAVFPPRTSVLCEWCSYRPMCPEGTQFRREPR